ncbi:MAG: glycine--tRNA ligase subunit beta [Pseudomonadota bacterium]|nr:glycine--tRNA ligase subunit beta [Pseudomonadota bacterium]
MPELLIEFFSEEIPAFMQIKAKKDIANIFEKAFNDANLEGYTINSMSGPRRLTLITKDLPEFQNSSIEEKKGPRVDSPQKAVDGFLKTNNVKDITKLEIRDLNKGKFYFLTRKIEGLPTKKIIEDTIIGVLKNFPWPKSMRWGEGNLRWVRPLINILVIFDGKVIPINFSGFLSSNQTYGHRFFSTSAIAVNNFREYKQKLYESKVIVDDRDRYQEISKQIDKILKDKDLVSDNDQKLMSELVGLVEWPVVYLGKIDESFMDVPKEILSSAMRKHQRYISLYNKDGSLSSNYIIVSNAETKDSGIEVIKGNNRVLRARLSDAKFFWQQDKSLTLDSRVNDLKDRIFHSKLGSLFDKVKRIEMLSSVVSNFIPDSNSTDAKRAAYLSKSDLLTGVVGEFPDLQGTMGYYYAKNDGESENVCSAIKDHYSPLGPSDYSPSSPISICLALADKIDTIVGFFGISQFPSGSKDPFALRRSSLGIIRIIIENKINLRLEDLINESYKTYQNNLILEEEELVKSILSFIEERLRVFLKDKGVSFDIINAALLSCGNIFEAYSRIFALKSFLDSNDGANLLSVYRRAVNIVRIESKKDKVDYFSHANIGIKYNKQAASLNTILEDLEPKLNKVLETNDFGKALEYLDVLRLPINTFLDNVMVNDRDEKVRTSNLCLLARVGIVIGKVADFSKIEG